MYNKSLITESVTKQEFPRSQPVQNPRYQFDSLKKVTNKNKFVKADTLVNEISPCPRIKLANSRTSSFDAVETGIFLLDFAQLLHCKNANVRDIYFTLLDATAVSPTLI